MNPLPYIDYSWYQMYLIFCFWGAVGWLIEVVDMAIETGHFQNRGFLHIPFCPIYGFGMLLIVILLKDISHSYIALFFAAMSVCTIFEYFVGVGLEKLFHARWWDYSHMRFNFKGLVCLRNALMFGFGSIFVMHIVEPFVESRIKLLPVTVGQHFLFWFSVLIALDTSFSLIKACRLKLRHRAFYEAALADNPDEEIVPKPFLIFPSHK